MRSRHFRNPPLSSKDIEYKEFIIHLASYQERVLVSLDLKDPSDGKGYALGYIGENVAEPTLYERMRGITWEKKIVDQIEALIKETHRKLAEYYIRIEEEKYSNESATLVAEKVCEILNKK